MHRQVELVEKRVDELKEELEKVQHTIDEIKNQESNGDTLNIIAYFSYTVMMPNHKRQHVNIIGSFIIKNIGSASLTNPMICLRFDPHQACTLSGKIGKEEVIDRDYSPIPSMETWSFLSNEAEEKAEESGEYWLTPVSTQALKPGNTLSFTNFQIKLDQENLKTKFMGNGFVYGNELKGGLPSINKINIRF